MYHYIINHSGCNRNCKFCLALYTYSTTIGYVKNSSNNKNQLFPDQVSTF